MHIIANDLALKFSMDIKGNKEIVISGISYVVDAVCGDLVLADNKKYFEQAIKSNCSVILADYIYSDNILDKTVLVSKDSQKIFLEILSMVCPDVLIPPDERNFSSVFIDPTAEIGTNCVIGRNTYIGAGSKIGNNCVFYPNCYVGANVSISDNCRFYPNVNIYDRSIIESGVILHSGVVIGSDGFGYQPCEINGVLKYPHIGITHICEDVEIGANTTIDRAKLGETYIGRGTKIDNLVQIGHNVKVGEFCMICAQSGIAGSTTIDNFCVLGAQVGLSDHINLGKRVIVSAKSGVTKDYPDGTILSGYPAHIVTQERRVEAIKNRLPDIYNRLKILEKKILEKDRNI